LALSAIFCSENCWCFPKEKGNSLDNILVVVYNLHKIDFGEKMVLSVSKAQENLDTVLDEVQNTFEPIIIAGKNSSGVLISEEAWRSVEETLYLCSIPGMKESIIAGMREKIEDCAAEIEW
jgi:prevent-host-death family protein